MLMTANPRTFTERAKGATQIGGERLDAGYPALVAAVLFVLLRSAELTQGSMTSLGRVHASSDVLGNLTLQMKTQLVIKCLLHSIPAENRT